MPDGRTSWTVYDGDDVVDEVREFILHLEALRFAPNTVRHYARQVVRLGNFLASSGSTFADLTPMMFDRFITLIGRNGRRFDTVGQAMNIVTLRKEHSTVSASLHNQVLFAVKAFYEFGDMRRHALASIHKGSRGPAIDAYKPFLQHVLARKAQRPREARSDLTAKARSAQRAAEFRLKPDQVLKIVEAATTGRDAFLVVLLYVTGMRIGEARGLLHEDMRLDEDVVWVTPRHLENGARAKGGRARPIPVPGFLMRLYEDYIASDDYLPAFETGTDFVFCNIRKGRIGRGLTEPNVYEIQRALIRRSGVEFTWHRFRHTHASEAIAQGYNLLDVADRLGHGSPQTTNAIYKHLFNSEYRKMLIKGHKHLEEHLGIANRRIVTEEQAKWL